jgi:Rad3-related DNA helicase
VCLPYSLLIERLHDFRNPIVIVDEAHNLAQSVLSSGSASLTFR